MITMSPEVETNKSDKSTDPENKQTTMENLPGTEVKNLESTKSVNKPSS